MSDRGRTGLGMNEPPSGYDVTVTVDRDGGTLHSPADFAVVTERAASNRNASVVSAHTAEQIISVVTVETSDRPGARRSGRCIRSGKTPGRVTQSLSGRWWPTRCGGSNHLPIPCAK